MPGRYLLDTNAVIALRDNDLTLIDLIPEADGAWISAVTIGELLYGALKSAKPEQSQRRLNAVLAGCSIAPCDYGTAVAYATARDSLRR